MNDYQTDIKFFCRSFQVLVKVDRHESRQDETSTWTWYMHFIVIIAHWVNFYFVNMSTTFFVDDRRFTFNLMTEKLKTSCDSIWLSHYHHSWRRWQRSWPMFLKTEWFLLNEVCKDNLMSFISRGKRELLDVLINCTVLPWGSQSIIIKFHRDCFSLTEVEVLHFLTWLGLETTYGSFVTDNEVVSLLFFLMFLLTSILSVL